MIMRKFVLGEMTVKRWMRLAMLVLLVPTVVITGAVLFSHRSYAWVSLCAALLICLPFFWRFERRRVPAAELVLVAVLVALAVAGRCLFAALPSIKPVAAIVIITGIYLGAEDGFMVGAMTALLSNFYFGQGMWTPFQMLAWGIVGLLAGLLAKPLRRSPILLAVYGAFAGVLFSAIMDVWTVLFFGQGFEFSRYAAVMLSSAQVTVTYVLSNVVFVLPLSYPLGRVLERVKRKYGLVQE